MLFRNLILITVIILTAILVGISGCTNDDRIYEPLSFPTDPVVFSDEFGSTVVYQAFAGSKLNALQLDRVNTYSGYQALQVVVPNVGDTSGSYAGGAFTAGIARDLRGYNALTFWAKASKVATLNVAGIGNDNTGMSKFIAEVNNLELTTEYQKFVIPIPLAEKLAQEDGLFYFAEGPEDGVGYQIYFDEIIFERLGSIGEPDPQFDTSPIDAEVGDTIVIGSQIVTFSVDGNDIDVHAMPGYFTFTSSNDSVVAVDSTGTITAVGTGTAELSAALGSIEADGSKIITVTGALAEPTSPAPTPTVPEADVISLFSNAYTDVVVNTWSAEWDNADVSDLNIGTDDVKKYENLGYAGIEFSDPSIDVTGMTRFHIDIWTPNSTASPAKFGIKLVDFGSDGDFGGGDDAEDELVFDENSSPALASGTWISIDLPMSAFSELTSRSNLAQLIISGDLSTVYVDNIYFYDAGPQTEPSLPAPIPDEDQSMVISLFSDVYTNVSVDTWSAVWDNATVTDFMIGSDNIKKYTNLVFSGIEFRNPTIDASTMTHFHMNIWTPDATASPSLFRIKLVDFGANGIYDNGGNDDVEHEVILDENTMNTGMWVNIDIPFSSFTDLTTRAHLGQLIISGNPNTVYIDNIYFYNSGIPLEPPEPAPTPAVDAADVISLFSDAYTNEPVDTWSAPWDTADVRDIMIAGNVTKEYTNLLFAGIEFTSNTIDASQMTHFHMDLWTPEPTDASSSFDIKLVDFGADGMWDGNSGGSDDVEHEITLGESVLDTGSWISIEVPLSDFVGLTTRGHLAQLIISGDPSTVFIDNIYFHK